MSERDEIQLRRIKSIWQSRQDAAGVMTLFLGLITLVVCVFLVIAPAGQIAFAMACLMVLLVLSCWRLISSAAKVVEVSKLLTPQRFDSDIIDADVVDSTQRRA